jgi:hypothetical protein
LLHSLLLDKLTLPPKRKRLLDLDHLQSLLGALTSTDAAGDALVGHGLVGMPEHHRVRAKTDARQAADAQIPPQAYDAPLVPVEGLRGTNVDALAALIAELGPGSVFVTADTNLRLVHVDLPEESLGTGLLTGTTRCAKLSVVG